MDADGAGGLMHLFAEHEEAIARLYTVYAAKLPDHAGFWSALAVDERNHAALARELARRVAAEDASFERGRFRIEAAKASLSFVEEQIAQAETRGISMQAALGIALDLEHGLIDRRFFEAFDGDSQDVVHVLDALKRETAEHRGVLEEAREGLRTARQAP